MVQKIRSIANHKKGNLAEINVTVKLSFLFSFEMSVKFVKNFKKKIGNNL